MITVKDLQAPHPLACPACKAPVLIAYPDRCEVPDGGYWLNDGDTVAAPHGVIVDEPGTGIKHDVELLVGACRTCGADYYVAQAGLISAAREVAQPYLSENVERGPQRNRLCSRSYVDAVEVSWLLEEYATPEGLLHAHTFGPWRLTDRDAVVGPYGVSSCASHGLSGSWGDAAALLLEVWPDLRSCYRQASALSRVHARYADDAEMPEANKVALAEAMVRDETIEELIEEKHIVPPEALFASIARKGAHPVVAADIEAFRLVFRGQPFYPAFLADTRLLQPLSTVIQEMREAAPNGTVEGWEFSFS